MSDLAKIEAEIAATREKLQKLEKEATELRKIEKQAALEEIWRKMSELGISTSDLKPSFNAKKRKPKVFRKYYLLEGVKYPIKPGRLPPPIAAFKASGGNLSEIMFSQEDEE